MDLYAFDRGYVDRLRQRDPETESHFFSYFTQLLRIKLRGRGFAPDVVDDARQETFIRVLNAVHKNDIREPERFGAYVNTTCNFIMQERFRGSSREQTSEDPHEESPGSQADKVLDVEGMLITKEVQQRVQAILVELPARDRDLLRAFFIEDKDKDEVCQQFGVDRDYFRVLLHRAKDKFKSLYEKDLPPCKAAQGG